MSNKILRDKNKSKFKLEGLPPIYYTNLDRSVERREYMEDQFEYWGIENVTRISGYDGTGDDDLGSILKGRYPDQMGPTDVGCCTSHLKAINQWYNESDSKCAIFMEDDCDLSPVKYWPFTWKEFYSKLPFDYDLIQLAVINPAGITMKMHKRYVNDFSTACFMMTRHHAKKIIDLTVRGKDKYRLDYKAKPRCNSEHLLYESGNSFAIPLLLYSSDDHPSVIHAQEHIDSFHIPCRNALRGFWQEQANDVNWNEMFDYDPYVGRLPPNVKME